MPRPDLAATRSVRSRATRVARSAVMAFAGVGLALGAAVAANAQETCKQMQVFLSISPGHREDVMAMIAPRLKQETGVDLIAEAIGSTIMVDRIAAQRDAPRISIAQWDVPIGIDACDKGLCAPVDLGRAPNAAKLFDWAYAK